MKKSILLLLCLALTGFAGENLLRNSEFSPDTRGWAGTGKTIPEEPGVARIYFDSNPRFWQLGLKLVEGERYKAGAWVRTKDLKAKRVALLFVNTAWDGDQFVGEVTDTRGEWVKIEKEITLFGSRDGIYSFGLYAWEPEEGIVDFKAPFLIPISERAKNESERCPEPPGNFRVTPVFPLLHHIYTDTDFLRFHYAEPIAGGANHAEMRIAMRRDDGKQSNFRGSISTQGIADVKLSKLEAGNYALTASLVDRKTGKTIASNEYRARVLKALPRQKAPRRLNNLVSMLDEGKLENSSRTFVNPREGWVFFAFDKPEKDAVGYLDAEEQPTVKYREGEASETMRYLPAGEYTFRVEGVQNADNRFSIRSVGWTQIYISGVWPYIPKEDNLNEMKYSLDFIKKYFFPAMNILNCEHWTPKSDFDKSLDVAFRERNIVFLGSIAYHKKHKEMSVAELKAYLLDNRIYNGKTAFGMALDEFYSGEMASTYLNLAEAVWGMPEDYPVGVCPFLTGDGDLGNPSVDMNFFSAIRNSSQGKGKMLFEAYYRSAANAKDFEKELDIYRTIARNANVLSPDGVSGLVYVGGAYMTPGDYLCNRFPETDPKFLIDRFYRDFATNPVYRGLGGLGIYTLSHCDEGTLRFYAACQRHYCVEGKTDSLAEKYGFVCNPGHLKNCDFEEGFSNWKAMPAGENTLKTLEIPRFGSKVQQRQGVGAGGNHVALFIADPKGANKLSQTAKNLTPGKTYSLAFATSDYTKVDDKKNIRVNFDFDVELDGAEIVPGSAHVYRSQVDSHAEVCTHRLLFKPLKSEVTLTFYDGKDGKPAPEGQQRLLNFIQLVPYFTGK